MKGIIKKSHIVFPIQDLKEDLYLYITSDVPYPENIHVVFACEVFHLSALTYIVFKFGV